MFEKQMNTNRFYWILHVTQSTQKTSDQNHEINEKRSKLVDECSLKIKTNEKKKQNGIVY